jgi:hypothetical protein
VILEVKLQPVFSIEVDENKTEAIEDEGLILAMK